MKIFSTIFFAFILISTFSAPQTAHAGFIADAVSGLVGAVGDAIGGIVDIAGNLIDNVTSITSGLFQGSINLIMGGSFSDGYKQGFCNLGGGGYGILNGGGCDDSTGKFWKIVSSSDSNGSITPAGTTVVEQGQSAVYKIVSGPVTKEPLPLSSGCVESMIPARSKILNVFLSVFDIKSAEAAAVNGVNCVQRYSSTNESGWVITSLMVDGVDQSAAKNATTFTYTFDTVSADHTISATFALASASPTASPIVEVFGVCLNTGGYNCTTGTLGTHSGDGTNGWTWYCDGTPNDAAHRSGSCSYKPTPITPAVSSCGTAAGVTSSSPDSSSLCKAGSSLVSSDSPFLICDDNEGNGESGVCDSSYYTDSPRWNWGCKTYAGVTSSCQAPYSSSVDTTVVTPGGCSASTISNCTLSPVSSGNSSGSCSSGNTGSCSYSCSDGTWSKISNSCIAAVWTNYCTGGSDINGNNWQIWAYSNETPPGWKYVAPGTVANGCVAPATTATCSNGLNISTYPSCTCPSNQIVSGSSCVAPTTTTNGACASRCIAYTNDINCSASPYTTLSPLCSSGSVTPTTKDNYTSYSAWACSGTGTGSQETGCSACAPGYSGVGCPVTVSTPPATCSNGLNISTYPSCTCPSNQIVSGSSCVAPTAAFVPADCYLDGATIVSGYQVTAYNSRSATSPVTCASETRYCTDSHLSGTYPYVGCTQLTPNIDSFTIIPTRVRSGGAVTIKWSSTDVTGCSVKKSSSTQTWSGKNSPVEGISDSVTIQTTYTITCDSLSKSVTVNVVPVYQEF